MSKTGFNTPAAFAEISCTSCQLILSSSAVGYCLIIAWIRSFQSPISFLRTPSTITGLHVAPTAPCSIEYVSSWMDAESFHRQVGVTCVISCRRLLYATELVGIVD